MVSVWIVAAVLAVTGVAAQPVDTALPGEESSPATLESLLTSFVRADQNEKLALIQQLETDHGRPAIALLTLVLENQFFYDDVPAESDEAVSFYRVTRTASGEDLVDQLRIDGADIDFEPVPDLAADQLERVQTTNNIRRALREAIARAALVNGDPGERLSAVESMLGALNDETAVLVASVRETEDDDDVRTLIDVALAIHTLGSSQDENRLAAAAKTLAGRLEPAARAALATAQRSGSGSAEFQALVQKSIDSTTRRVEWYGFVEKLFFGLSLGSVLLLAAIGLAITFGVMGVINMAHGEMIMLGAYTTYVVQLLMPESLHYSVLVAIPAAFLVSGLAGVAIEQGIIRFLHGRPLETLLATFGLSLILQQLVRTIFSPLNRQVASPDWMSGSLSINPVLSLTYNRLYILGFSLLMFLLLLYVFKKTNLGLYVRAVSQNRAMAKAMGVNTRRIDALTFGLGSGVAGVAGVALSQLTNVGPNLGQSYIIDSFLVVVFGGVGNLMGTLVGAFSLGIANKFLEPVTGAVMANILVLLFIILFIQKRPRGLFPQKGRAAE